MSASIHVMFPYKMVKITPYIIRILTQKSIYGLSAEPILILYIFNYIYSHLRYESIFAAIQTYDKLATI
jgi:hypothetical protein